LSEENPVKTLKGKGLETRKKQIFLAVGEVRAHAAQKSGRQMGGGARSKKHQEVVPNDVWTRGSHKPTEQRRFWFWCIDVTSRRQDSRNGNEAGGESRGNQYS